MPIEDLSFFTTYKIHLVIISSFVIYVLGYVLMKYKARKWEEELNKKGGNNEEI